jgi:hypothetical protein
MVNYSQCNWGKCIQKTVCSRYIEPKNNNVLHFENLCFEKNDWKWFYGDRSKMIKVKLIEEKKEDVMHNEEKKE